jgi:hypothetical protein
MISALLDQASAFVGGHRLSEEGGCDVAEIPFFAGAGLDALRCEEVKPLGRVVGVVRPGVVLEDVGAACSHLADAPPGELAEVDEEIGGMPFCWE